MQLVHARGFYRILIIPLLVGLAILASVAYVFRFSVAPQPPLCKNCNVIVVALDTVGANHLPCYGYARNTAPNLCTFAKNNIVFQHAYANSTWTLPSDVSMFTSWYPLFHGIRDFTDYTMQLPVTVPFLPEILQRAGYETLLGIPENDRAFPQDAVYYRGISQVIGHAPGPDEDLNSALAAFSQRVHEGHKTFLFLHSYQAHGPYIPKNPKPLFTDDVIPSIPTTWSQIYDGPFTKDYLQFLLDELAKEIDKPNAIVSRDFYEQLKQAPTLVEAKKLADTKAVELESFLTEYYYFAKIKRSDPRQVEFVKALYDQKIFELDDWIGKTLLPFLNTPEIRDNTIVLFTAEHGEEFMEHGRMTHETMYDSNVHVPFILRVPGKGPREIGVPVQGVDVTPTILSLVGVRSSGPFQGTSLVPTLMGQTLPDRLLFTDGYTDKTARTATWKLFFKRLENGTLLPYEFYDTLGDPSESTNVLASHVRAVKQLLWQTQRYEAFWRRKLIKSIPSQ